MAQTGYTPISLYYSTTAAAVPLNTNLVNGELAINITDGKLFYKDNAGVVQVIVVPPVTVRPVAAAPPIVAVTVPPKLAPRIVTESAMPSEKDRPPQPDVARPRIGRS